MQGLSRRAMILSLAFLTPLPLRAGSPDLDGFTAGIYKDSRGKAISYRLYLPAAPDPSARYPLVLYLHGFEGLGKDNNRQISGLSYLGSHVWTMPLNQAANPCFVLAPH
jgi:predicted peptidase